MNISHPDKLLQTFKLPNILSKIMKKNRAEIWFKKAMLGTNPFSFMERISVCTDQIISPLELIRTQNLNFGCVSYGLECVESRWRVQGIEDGWQDRV